MGGAERSLLRVVSNLDPERFTSCVISLTDRGELGDVIEELAIPLYCIGMRRGVADPRGLYRLIKRIRAERPELVQTWMYHADLMGGLAAKVARRPPVIWNLRNSDLDPMQSKRSTILTARLCAALSRSLCSRIVSCAESAAELHANLGYDASRMITIPNGFDIEKFKPGASASTDIRSLLEIDESNLIVGVVGRFDPQKDHEGFLKAASALPKRLESVHFVFCGTGMSSDNTQLVEWIDDAHLSDRVHLLGPRTDIAKIIRGFDVACSPSAYGEAFPNVVGEAMACGVPCVVTDVGDSRYIVGDSGVVVPPRDAAALTQALTEVLDMDDNVRRALGQAARQRIAENFTLRNTIEKYENLYLTAAAPAD